MNETTAEAIYDNRARLYDVIYQWKNYAAEARRLRDLLHEEGIGDGARVLEAACGTGTYMLYLRSWFNMAGFDLSPVMLELAREKLGPEHHLFKANMADFAVDPPYDALLCLFSSIGYVFPESRLRETAACYARAVRPGGAIVVEPFVDPDDLIPGYVEMQRAVCGPMQIVRASTTRQEDDFAVLEFRWLTVDRERREIDSFTEEHRLLLVPRARLADIFEEAGFDCRFESDGLMPGRGLLIGRRR